MNDADKEMNRKKENLLKAMMLLLNLSALSMAAFVGWSVYSLVQNSTAIINVVKGDFLP